jgi:RNA polymerase sigma-70 factor (ECF subfamily)
MEAICQCYWYPIYAYLRRSRYSPTDAEDLTQGFFERLICEEAMLGADRERGRLRSYLLGVMKRFLSDDKRHREALKRGGGTHRVSFDEEEAEHRYQQESDHLREPSELFDRAWARDLLCNATDKLRQSFVEGGNAEAFEHLSEFLPLGANSSPYSEVAGKMAVAENVVRLQVHRMRKRYRTLIENEIALTVQDPGQIEAELEHLMAAVGR